MTTARTIPLTALAAAAALLLAACANPGPDQAPIAQTTAPQLDLAATPTASVDARWWTALGDAQLDALIAQALAGSPNLAMAHARTSRALVLAQATQAASGPQAVLNTNAVRQRFSANGIYPAPLGGNVWNMGTVEADFSWTPDFFGHLRDELKFDGLDALVVQMKRDEEEARALLSGVKPLGPIDQRLCF